MMMMLMGMKVTQEPEATKLRRIENSEERNIAYPA